MQVASFTLHLKALHMILEPLIQSYPFLSIFQTYVQLSSLKLLVFHVSWYLTFTF